MNTRRLLPVLSLLFVGSGCAALIYEIVWFQLLQFVIGSSAVSLGVLLGTFMGGMCLGSLLLPRVISPAQHPLKVYAMLEMAIGAIGILILGVVPLVGGVYTAYAGHGLAGILLRGTLAALCLLPPTMMMGATLPAISRWIETTRHGISWLGFFYAGNIFGAVLGCLLATFYLLRVFDMRVATLVAVAINAAVAVISLRLSNRTPHKLAAGESAAAPDEVVSGRGGLPVHVAIALSGLAALGAEAVWTRQLSLIFGATVYAFSIILAVFLTGLGIGSSGGAFLARKTKRPALAMAICQIAVTAAIAWASWNITYSLPYWKIDPVLSADPWYTFRVDFIRCLWAILPASLLWGASFPLALASAASHGRDPGRLIGGLYAANTVGAILGGLAFSTFVVPLGGSQQAGRFLVAASALSALIMLALNRSRTINLAGWAATIGIAVLTGWNIPPLPGLLVAYGREFSIWAKMPPAVRYVGEGMNSSVAITEWPSGVRNFHVSGKIEASSAARDMRLERMLGHLPALLHPNPRSVLVVGFGAGVTAGSFVLHPGVERIVICEIEPLIPKVVSSYFKDENYDVLRDPRVEVVYDDARHFVLTTQEKFDVITSDPIHPWVKGAAALFSTEYFESVRNHLNPGGVVSQWVPLYDSTEDVVKSEIATFLKTFPTGTIWNSDLLGNGYDTVLIGQDGPGKIDLDALDARLSRPDHEAVVRSLVQVKFSPPLSLLTTYSGSAADMRTWLADAAINSDRNLRLQYLAGLVMNLSEADKIFSAISRNWTFPEQMFTGSPVMREGLRQALIEQLAPSRR